MHHRLSNGAGKKGWELLATKRRRKMVMIGVINLTLLGSVHGVTISGAAKQVVPSAAAAAVQVRGHHRRRSPRGAAGTGRTPEVELGDVGHPGGGGRGAVVAGPAVVDALVVKEALEDVAVDGHRGLVRVLVFPVVDGRHPHALEHRRRPHLPRQLLPERRILVAGGSVEAAGGGRVGGGGVGGGGLGGEAKGESGEQRQRQEEGSEGRERRGGSARDAGSFGEAWLLFG